MNPGAVHFVGVADHDVHWKTVRWSGRDLTATLMDIRFYYQEAAVALADHVPGAHQTDAWFYGRTEMGRLLRRFQAAVEAQDPPFPASRTLLPGYQQ